MVARGHGRVLHVGSGMGQRPRADWSAYSVSKAAVSRLTDTVGVALEGTGVTLLEVSPGLVRTDMTETMWGPPDEQLWNDVARVVAVVRRFAAGELDALHGRFVHAARDDLDALVAAAAEIRDADARTLRLRTWGDADPLA
jgi:3-oxoacyl-[acyl-carrier protein] reductase